ncbi:hypothetical protein GUJ73_25610, partial|nr:hypothetical protein [Escherichia coli]
GHGTVIQKISFQVFTGTALVQAICNNNQQGNSEYKPVESAHEKYLVNHPKKIISITSTTSTKMYQLRQEEKSGMLFLFFSRLFFTAQQASRQ